MLDPRRLVVLREVVAQGSFSRAAAALHLTQPAVSRQIAALEREAGTRLLERTSRGPALTEAGEVALTHADAIAAHLREAEAELDALAALERGRLRVAAFPTAGATLVMRAIRAFRGRYPGVELEFAELASVPALRALRAAEIDLAVVFQPRGTEAPADGLERVHLLTETMTAALPRGHRLAGRRSLRLAELADEGWIQGSQPGSRLIRAACVEAGFEPRIVSETDHAPITHGLVAAGVGVTLVPGLGIELVRGDVALVPLAEPAPRREVLAVVRAGSRRPPPVAAMLQLLAAEAAART